jgi:hypothetical protein
LEKALPKISFFEKLFPKISFCEKAYFKNNLPAKN